MNTFNEQDNADQLGDRSLYIGGSDVGSIMNVNPWKSYRQLLSDKINKVTIEPNYLMQRGSFLEPLIRKSFEKEFDCHVLSGKLTYTHPKYPFMQFHDDGQVNDNLVEFKSTGFSSFKKYKREGCPLMYQYQLQHGLNILGLDLALIYFQEPTNGDTILVEIPRDQAIIDRIETECVKFWGLKESGVIPEWVTDETKVIKPEKQDDANYTLEFHELAGRYSSVKKQLTHYQAQEKELGNQIKGIMQSTERMGFNGGYFTYRYSEGKKTFDKKLCFKENPDMVKYEKTGEAYRTFKAQFDAE